MSGQVTTVVVDTALRGVGVPVEVVRLGPVVSVLRVRIYTQIDPRRDLWEVMERGAATVVGGDVLASGPAGPVRVIVSATE